MSNGSVFNNRIGKVNNLIQAGTINSPIEFNDTGSSVAADLDQLIKTIHSLSAQDPSWVAIISHLESARESLPNNAALTRRILEAIEPLVPSESKARAELARLIAEMS